MVPRLNAAGWNAGSENDVRNFQSEKSALFGCFFLRQTWDLNMILSYAKSFVSAVQIERKAKISEITVKTMGSTALFESVKSPMLA